MRVDRRAHQRSSTPPDLPPSYSRNPPRCFPQTLSYMLGLEQMSQLKCVGVLLSVAGAVWVEFFATTSDWAVSEADAAATAAAAAVAAATMETAAAEAGEAVPGGDDIAASWGWVGSLILLWQVCVCVCVCVCVFVFSSLAPSTLQPADRLKDVSLWWGNNAQTHS